MKRIYCEVTKEEYFDLLDEFHQIAKNKSSECEIKIYDNTYPWVSICLEPGYIDILLFNSVYNRYEFLINWQQITEDNFLDWFNSGYEVRIIKGE